MQQGEDSERGSKYGSPETDCYPWSWPWPLPAGAEIACPFVRSALRVAEALACRRFYFHRDYEELVCDAVSVAWELAVRERSQKRGHPGSVAAFAVKRVASGLQFPLSERDLRHPTPRSRPLPLKLEFDTNISKNEERTCPVEQARLRIDFSAWLRSLTARQREVAESLATRHTVREIAERSGCTTNAVRMMRMALRRSYQAFFEDTEN